MPNAAREHDSRQCAGGLRATLTWDAENRLIGFTPVAPTAESRKVEFTYDYLSRRVRQKAYAWANGQWETTPAEERMFVWHGWRMLMELDGLAGTGVSPVVRKYAWGLDLAGQSGGQTSGLSALEGAGGIGGLLAVTTRTARRPMRTTT